MTSSSSPKLSIRQFPQPKKAAIDARFTQEISKVQLNRAFPCSICRAIGGSCGKHHSEYLSGGNGKLPREHHCDHQSLRGDGCRHVPAFSLQAGDQGSGSGSQNGALETSSARQRARDPGMMPLAMEWRSVGVLTPFITNKVHGIYQLSESCKDGILDLPTP